MTEAYVVVHGSTVLRVELPEVTKEGHYWKIGEWSFDPIEEYEVNPATVERDVAVMISKYLYIKEAPKRLAEPAHAIKPATAEVKLAEAQRLMGGANA